MSSDRRARFRDHMARLDPNAPAARAMVRGWYVAPPSAVSGRIANRLELDPASTHLLIGGIGSGKTTEILAIQSRLATMGDLVGIYVDVPGRQRLDKPQEGLLLALGALLVCEHLASLGPEAEREPEVAAAVAKIRTIAEGDLDDARRDQWDGYDPGGERWYPGVLAPPEGVPHSDALLTAIKQVIPALPARPVLLFDGLDRLTDTAAFAILVGRDVGLLAAAGLGVVLVAPPHLAFRPEWWLHDRFTEVHLHGPTAVEADRHAFLVSVLRARADAEMLPDPSGEAIARLSGGLLRDLIALARGALQEAYDTGAESVSVEHVGRAADRLGRGLLLGIPQEAAKRLKTFVTHTHRGGKTQIIAKELQFTLATELDVSLLLARLIIEIPGLPPRYVPHPATVELIAGLP